jgi:hypothetical protein
MGVRLTQGTKEYVTCAVIDTTGTVDDLAADGGSSPQFDVLDDSNAVKYNNQAASFAGMSIRMLVDTNSGGLWAVGHYRIFPEFTLGSEAVRLGPFDLYVTDQP